MRSERIRYINRTRNYYEAQGFDTPYQWAHHDDIPFHRPSKTVARSRIAIVTTAIHPDDASKPMISRVARSFAIEETPENFYTMDLSWDKITTHTDDRASYFPFEVLTALEAEDRIGSLAPRFHFVPTEYSQRHTIRADGPATRDACLEDEVDIALLVPL